MTVALVHGFLGGADTWRDVVDGLGADAAVQLVALPGHGARPWRPASDAFFDIALAIADALPRDVVLVGYSMGARVALAIALRRPELVRAAVLIGVDPGIEDPVVRAARIAVDDARAAAVLADGVDAFVDAWQELPLFATQRALPPATRERVRAERTAHAREPLAWAIRALGIGRMPSMWGELVGCAVPLRVITGALDDKFTTIARALVAIAPNARHRIVAGAGHNVAIEAPDVVVDEIRRAFLGKEQAA
jgi:2-succinyl-6-hydroxy-2,4-cyclohexadiene-1-carboxylate synthase